VQDRRRLRLGPDNANPRDCQQAGGGQRVQVPAMTIEVTVLRVFTDSDGRFGNASTVPAAQRQQLAKELSYSETVFVDPPEPGATTTEAHIFTPAVEAAFAGHPALGAAWWLRHRGTPVRTLHLAAGLLEIGYRDDVTVIRASGQWTPEFVIEEMPHPHDVMQADPDDYDDGFAHYLWAWGDKAAGHIRARAFAPELGVAEDEDTGAAAIRITENLSRNLTITQGKGSLIYTWWSAQGWVDIGGRLILDGITTV
jgi:predicted PhzF superfamily epimerase YddE/YHI9